MCLPDGRWVSSSCSRATYAIEESAEVECGFMGEEVFDFCACGVHGVCFKGI